MNTKAFFPCGGGSNLILGTGIENQIFCLRTRATVKFFTKLSKNDTFAKRRKIFTHPDGFLLHLYGVPHYSLKEL